jgi:hypothetical protein
MRRKFVWLMAGLLTVILVTLAAVYPRAAPDPPLHEGMSMAQVDRILGAPYVSQLTMGTCHSVYRDGSEWTAYRVTCVSYELVPGEATVVEWTSCTEPPDWLTRLLNLAP